MQIVYAVLEKALPFQWIQFDFMKNAFLAILLISPLFGVLGTMVVNRKMAFFSDALGHSALTGMAIGVVLGVSNTNLSMILFAVCFALGLNQIKSKDRVGTDTIISVFSSLSIALGLLILSRGGNFSSYSGLLVGDILSISPKEIFYLAIVLAATLGFWCFCFNHLHAVSIHRTLAKSRGVKVQMIDHMFVVLIALIVMISIRWIGILLINALLILPAAASRNIAVNMREYHFFSVLFSLFSGITGLIVSYYGDLATGPAIIMIASVIFFGTYFYGRRKPA